MAMSASSIRCHRQFRETLSFVRCVAGLILCGAICRTLGLGRRILLLAAVVLGQALNLFAGLVHQFLALLDGLFGRLLDFASLDFDRCLLLLLVVLELDLTCRIADDGKTSDQQTTH
jgi:hypothetical protein